MGTTSGAGSLTFGAQLVREARPGESPRPLDRAQRHAHDLGDLWQRQPCEEPELDQSVELWIIRLQALECMLEREQVLGCCLRGQGQLVELDPAPPAADGDGWLDVLSIPFIESQMYWYQNPGQPGLKFGKLWPRHLLVDTSQGSNEAAWLRDMDGDGTPEFLVNSWNVGRPMCYWKLSTTSEGKPTATRVLVARKGNGHGQGFGDLNQDGREDIVFGGGWYERPAKPGMWQLHADFALPSASCPVIVVDLNGDGRNDMLWGSGYDYGLYYHEQL